MSRDRIAAMSHGPLTVSDLKEMLRLQVPPMGDLRTVTSLLVSPDVHAEVLLYAQMLPDSAQSHGVIPMFTWELVVDRTLPKGTIIPRDANGETVTSPHRGEEP